MRVFESNMLGFVGEEVLVSCDKGVIHLFFL